MKCISIVAFLTLMWCAGVADFAEAAGPWRGQVVDAESGKPLEGVVVLSVWDKLSPGAMHQRREFHDVDEVVTDAEGRFVIPERRLFTWNPFVSIDGPQLQMFKAGYGRWRFRGEEEWLKLQIYERNKRYDEAWKLFKGDGVVFEVPPLKSREEKLKFVGHAEPSGRISASKMQRYLEALDQERVRLGLQPLKRTE